MDDMPNDFRNTINQIEQDHQTVAKSTLSALASEFVPRFAMNATSQVNPSAATNTSLSSNDSYQNYAYQAKNPTGYSEYLPKTNVVTNEPSIDEQDDFIALNQLRDFMDTIAESPAEYDTLLPQITEVLNHWMNEDPDIILHCVVNNIVDRAITNNNFRYNGVRLCLHLLKKLNVTSSKGPFKTLLLQRCKREHARRSALATASDGGTYLRGLTFFIGDLCTKLHEAELTEAVPDLLQSLIEQKSTDNLKTTCQVLKLCGQHVDLYLKTVGSPAMDDLFSFLKAIGERADQHPSVLALIKSVVELRDRNWTSASSNGFAHQYAQNNPYANEGALEDSSDMSGYDFGPCGDEGNVDVCDAFEEFLRASGQVD